MKHTRIFTLLFCSIVLLSGCNSENGNDEVSQEIARLKKEKKENSSFSVHETSVYDPEYGCFINRKDRLFQDMYLKPEIDDDGLFFRPYFYNYGGEITLNNRYLSDIFLSLGHVNAIFPMEDFHGLSIQRTISNEKYGVSAVAIWEIQGMTISNIFITPMAYNAYRTRSGDDYLIFVQFIGDNKKMNVIFRGNDFERTMADRGSNSIRERGIIEHMLIDEGGFAGQFWH